MYLRIIIIEFVGIGIEIEIEGGSKFLISFLYNIQYDEDIRRP